MIEEILSFYSMTSTELARFLGVTVWTVERWRKKRKPTKPVGLQDSCLYAMWSFAIESKGNKRLLLSRLRFGVGYFLLLGLRKGMELEKL